MVLTATSHDVKDCSLSLDKPSEYVLKERRGTCEALMAVDSWNSNSNWLFAQEVVE